MDLGDFNPVRILAGKGEIGKSGLGSALATLALDYFVPGLGEAAGLGMGNAATAATLVGGTTALASGSLQKGLMAGLSAYGTEEMLGGAQKGIEQAATDKIEQTMDLSAKLSPMEKLTSGLQGIKAMPTMDMLKYGAMAAAPVLTAQAQKGLPSNPTNPNAYIRPKAYDPVSHRYYDLPAVKASDWGSQSIADYVNSQVAPATAKRGGLMAAYADGGMAGYATGGGDGAGNPSPTDGSNAQLEFENEPAIRMAHGGRIKRYAGETDGSVVSSAPSAEVAAAINAANMGFAPGTTAQDVVSSFNLNPAQAAQVAQAIGYTGDLSGLNYGAAASAAPTAAPTPTAGWDAIQHAENVLYPSNAPVYANYSTDQLNTFFANPANAAVLQTPGGLSAAEAKYNADPNAVNKYLTGLAGAYYDPTATQKGSGTLNTYQQLMKEGVSPAVFSAAEKAVNPDWGKTGYWNQDTVARAYQVADKVLQFDPLTDKVTPSDKQWVAFMDQNKLSPKDISIATGLTEKEVQDRYNAAKNTPITNIVPGDTQLPTATTYDNGAFGNYGSGNKTGVDYLGRTVSIATPGDIITNPDQTRSVVSNIPGRPYGGFTGMDAVKSAYTAGGGNLGQVLKPTKTYQNTGTSADVYNYLGGTGKWSDINPQPAPKPKNTYSSFTAPTPAEKAQYSKYAKVWKDGAVVDNPYYGASASSSTSSAGGVGTTDKTVSLPDNTTAAQLTAYPTIYKDSKGYFYDQKGNLIAKNEAEFQSYINPAKTGGLMAAMAPGGVTNSLRTLLTGDVQNAYDKLDAKGLGNSKQGKQLKQELDYRARMKSYQQTPQAMPTTDQTSDQTDDQSPNPFAAGGQAHYNLGGYSDGGRLLKGPGDGVSDSIPATIGGKQPARLADGEFVVPARIVSEIGNGSTEAGARKLYAMMDRVQQARGKTVGKGKVAKNTRADRYLPA